MGKNGERGNGNAVPCSDSPGTASERDPSLILDEQLNSAAAPFLYLLSSVMIAVAAYLLYTLLDG